MRLFGLLLLCASLGCAAGKSATKPNSTSNVPHVSETEKAAKRNPQLNKAGKLETKALPRKPQELVASVQRDDLDKVLACLKEHQISFITKERENLVDVLVPQTDSDRAGKLLLADSEEHHYTLHADASSPIRSNL